MEQAFDEFLVFASVGKDLTEQEKLDIRIHFYAGALALLEMQSSASELPSDLRETRIARIHQDLYEFSESIIE